MKCPNCGHEFQPPARKVVDFQCEHCGIITSFSIMITANESIKMVCGCGREMKLVKPNPNVINLICAESLVPV